MVHSTERPKSRIHKLIAESGLGSRRKAEEWIRSGRVKVDGRIATIGELVDGSEHITVDDVAVRSQHETRPRILVSNKNTGVEVSRNPHGDLPSAFDDLPRLRSGRWMSVGRLDVNTSGLLMYTNVGEIAHRLSHPSSGIDREYAVRINRRLGDRNIQNLLDGVDLDGVLQRFTDVQYFSGSKSTHWYHVVLMEGRNHEVRRLFASQSATVTRLKRVRFGPVVVPSWIRRGETVEMSKDDVYRVCRWLEVPCSRSTIGSRFSIRKSLLLPYEGLAETGRPIR